MEKFVARRETIKFCANIFYSKNENWRSSCNARYRPTASAYVNYIRVTLVAYTNIIKKWSEQCDGLQGATAVFYVISHSVEVPKKSPSIRNIVHWIIINLPLAFLIRFNFFCSTTESWKMELRIFLPTYTQSKSNWNVSRLVAIHDRWSKRTAIRDSETLNYTVYTDPSE